MTYKGFSNTEYHITQNSCKLSKPLTSLLQRSEITGIVGKAVSTAEATVEADTKGALLLDEEEAAGDETGGCCEQNCIV